MCVSWRTCSNVASFSGARVGLRAAFDVGPVGTEAGARGRSLEDLPLEGGMAVLRGLTAEAEKELDRAGPEGVARPPESGCRGAPR